MCRTGPRDSYSFGQKPIASRECRADRRRSKCAHNVHDRKHLRRRLHDGRGASVRLGSNRSACPAAACVRRRQRRIDCRHRDGRTAADTDAEIARIRSVATWGLRAAARVFDDVMLETVVPFGTPAETALDAETYAPPDRRALRGAGLLARLRAWALRRRLARQPGTRVLVLDAPVRRAGEEAPQGLLAGRASAESERRPSGGPEEAPTSEPPPSGAGRQYHIRLRHGDRVREEGRA
jgi:hypothetical protein